MLYKPDSLNNKGNNKHPLPIIELQVTKIVRKDEFVFP